MKGVAFGVSVLVLVTISGASAEDIQLKVNFLGGWQYSADGLAFDKVGMTGKNLRLAMEANETAQKEIDVYKSRKVTALVSGLAGVVLAAVALENAANKDDLNESDIILLLLPLPFIITSSACEVSATNHLPKAVYLYNSGKTTLSMDARYQRALAADDGRLAVALSMRF